MGTLPDRLGVMFDPRFWARTDRVSSLWDSSLNRLLDAVERGDVAVSVGHFRAVFADKVEVWIENWPYAYGRPCPNGAGPYSVLPRRKTALRLRRVLDEHAVKDATQ